MLFRRDFQVCLPPTGSCFVAEVVRIFGECKASHSCPLFVRSLSALVWASVGPVPATFALRDFSGHRALYEKTIYFAFFRILENVCFAFLFKPGFVFALFLLLSLCLHLRSLPLSTVPCAGFITILCIRYFTFFCPLCVNLCLGSIRQCQPQRGTQRGMQRGMQKKQSQNQNAKKCKQMQILHFFEFFFAFGFSAFLASIFLLHLFLRFGFV